MFDIRICVAAAAAVAVVSPAWAQPLTRAPDGRALVVTFSDDFDSFRPFVGGKGVWRTFLRNGDGKPFTERTIQGNKELQIYVDRDWRPDGGPPLGVDPFAVKGGALEITAQPASAAVSKRIAGYRYTSGLVSTQPSFSQTYGYFEMRARLPRGKGVWPAFWMLPADMSWPPEIDVMENIGEPDKVYVTAHSTVVKAVGTVAAISPDAFHTYAVSWDKDMLAWYVDGREVKRQLTPPDMHKPMYMLANVALGGDWAGTPDSGTPFPATMRIDYIRAYRFAP